MKQLSRIAQVALGLCLPGVVFCSFGARAEDSNRGKQDPEELSRRLENLQKEIELLRAELAQLKTQAGTSSDNASTPDSTTPSSPTLVGVSSSPAREATNPLGTLLGSTSLSGFLDVYYGYNFNHPKSRTTAFRAFDAPSNEFGLNLMELDFDRPPEGTNSRLGFHLGLGFGQAMNVMNAGDPGGLGFAQHLKEAYFSYLAPVGRDGLQVDVGKFVTPHGAEVIQTKDNWNYSRGLLFTYAIPFYHFGVRAKYAFNSKYALTGFLVNGWNNIVDNNTGKTLGVSFGWNPTKKISVTQNYMIGPEMADANASRRHISDTTLTYTPTTKLALMLNYDYVRGEQLVGLARRPYWTGVAGYLRYVLSDLYTLATRYEYFEDPDGFTTGTAQRLKEFTATFERRVARHLITRLEFRRDSSNQPAFLKGERPVKGQNTLLGGVVCVFDTRETLQ